MESQRKRVNADSVDWQYGGNRQVRLCKKKICDARPKYNFLFLLLWTYRLDGCQMISWKL